MGVTAHHYTARHTNILTATANRRYSNGTDKFENTYIQLFTAEYDYSTGTDTDRQGCAAGP